MKFSRQFWLSILILIISIYYIKHISHGKAVPLRKSLKEFPLKLGAWTGTEKGLKQEIIDILGVEDPMMRVYTNNDRFPIWLYIGYYESQSRGDIIHSPKHCYPGSGWQTLETGIEEIKISHLNKEKIRVNRFLIQKGLEKQLVLYWYHERGRINTSEYWAKFYLIFDAVTRNRTDGSLVRISAPVIDSVEQTLKREKEFIGLMFPYLKEFLPD